MQVAVTIVILWFVGQELAGQWERFKNVPLTVHPRWGMIGLSALVVLATYAVLIETWRYIVLAWGDRVSFLDAARIYFVANLVRYVPWNQAFQLAAYAELSRRRRVSPAAATGGAVISTVVNITMGFVIAIVLGFSARDTLFRGHAGFAVMLAALLVAGVLVLPFALPHVVALAQRVTGRTLTIGDLPHRAIYVAFVGNVIAWVLYGIAYQLLVAGVLGRAPGSTADYIAVWAAAYVGGYLALALPAGVGVREGVQTAALPQLGLATASQAALVAVCSRLLLTVLEILPGVFFLAQGTRHRPQASTPLDGSNP